MYHIHIWAKFVFSYEVIKDVFHCQQGIHRKYIKGIEKSSILQSVGNHEERYTAGIIHTQIFSVYISSLPGI